eukprot:g11557.t1
MSVSPQLLALMSVTPTYSGGVTSWSIFMDFRYPFPWETTAAFVLRVKAKGPPDDMVTLEVDRNVFKYHVRMPWYARLVLGKTIAWNDVLQADPTTKTLSEEGINTSLRRMGTVRDCSCWRGCEEDPNVTLYSKRVDFDIRMRVGPTIMMQVAQPLMRWFRTKSHLCRELEVEAIREFIESEKGHTDEERAKRLQDDAAWMVALTAATPTPTPAPPSPSCSSPPSVDSAPSCSSAARSSEAEPPVSRLAAARGRVKDLAAWVRARFARAASRGGAAAERSRPQTAADGSSV